jgi:hypothetical protein
MDGINAVRLLLPRMFFDAERCADGLEALRQYRTDYDEKTRAFKDTPRHDWASHAADAARYMCMAYQEVIAPKEEPAQGYFLLVDLERIGQQRPDRCDAAPKGRHGLQSRRRRLSADSSLRLPWVTSGYEPSPDAFKWELYNINEDFGALANCPQLTVSRQSSGCRDSA